MWWNALRSVGYILPPGKTPLLKLVWETSGCAAMLWKLKPKGKPDISSGYILEKKALTIKTNRYKWKKKSYDKTKYIQGISQFLDFLLVFPDPSFRAGVVFVLPPAKKTSACRWTWSCYFPWWPSGNWLAESQGGAFFLKLWNPWPISH